MRVTVDVSVIGLARLFETARTGIYRVISSLLPELLDLEDLDLRVTSLSSTEVNRLTRAFLEERDQGHRFAGTFPLEERLFQAVSRLAPLDRLGIGPRLVARLFRQQRIRRIGSDTDILHSTFNALPDCPTNVVRFLSIYDMIPCIHPEYFWQGFDREFRGIVASVRPKEDFVLTISEASRRDICNQLGMDADRVFIAYPAASRRLYHPEPDPERRQEAMTRYGIPEAGYILSLATLEHRKNLQASIAAYRQVVAQEGGNVGHLVLVGTRGWKVDRLLAQIADDLLLRDRVILTGYVQDDDLSAIYSCARVFVYPSLYEGFGLPPLEAMCCGIPVITANTSALPEVVGEAGITVDPLDIDALSAALLRVLGDDALRDRMIEQGLQRCQRFSWQRCAQETAAAYRRAWDGRA